MSEGKNTMSMSCSRGARCAARMYQYQYQIFNIIDIGVSPLKKYRLFDTSGYWLRDHLKVYSTLYQNKLYFR